MSPDYAAIATPCFVLEERLLRRNLQLIHRVQQEAEVTVILAFKAFALWPVFPIVREYLKAATASSLNEARLCWEEMGVKAHTYAPAFIPAEFPEILQLSSHISFNSLSQYQRYRETLTANQWPVSCGLRVNPEHTEVETGLYNPAAPGSRLGLAPDELRPGLPEGIEGLHFHTLCESDSYALERTLASFEKKFGHCLPALKWVNMGGGHLITHADYDLPHLISLLRGFKKRHQLEVFLEPGSAIVWQTGVLVTSVLDIVERHGIQTAIIDASFTAHMPDTLEMPYRPRIRGATDAGPDAPHHYRIGGMSCLAGDFMEAYGFEEPLKIGDRIVLEDMMHYTLVKSTMFNGVTHPSVALWTEQGQLQLLRTFTYLDYKNRMG